MVLAIGAGIMFLLSFIIRKNDPSRRRRESRWAKLPHCQRAAAGVK